jgi:hypothetical protein
MRRGSIAEGELSTTRKALRLPTEAWALQRLRYSRELKMRAMITSESATLYWTIWASRPKRPTNSRKSAPICRMLFRVTVNCWQTSRA